MNSMMVCLKRSFAMVALLLFGVHQTLAANGTWNCTTAGSNAYWTNSLNWSASPYPAGNQVASFSNAGNGQTTVNVEGLSVISNIVFDTVFAVPYTIGSGGVNQQTLVITNGAQIQLTSTANNSQLFNTTVLLGFDRSTGSYTFRNDHAYNTLTFAGDISATNSGGTAGAKTLNVAGIGAVTLSGSIRTNGVSALTLTDTATGTLLLTGTNMVNTLNANGGFLNLTGSNIVNTLNINSTSAINIGSGNLILDNKGANVLNANQDCTINGTGKIWLSTQDTITSNGNNYADCNVAAGKTLIINPEITGPGGLEVWSGAGTYVLNGINTFDAHVIIGVAGATVSVSKFGNRGSTTSNLGKGTNFIFSGASSKLVYTGTGETSNRQLIFNNTPSIIDQSGSGNLAFSTSPTLASGAKSLTLQGSTSGTGEFSGVLANSSGTLSVFKTGTGTWLLSTNNTFTGATAIDSGTLALTGVSGAINASTGYTLSSGATLLLDNTATANNTNRLRDASAITLNGGTLSFSNSGGSVSYVENAGALTVSISNSAIATVQAAVGQTATLRFASLARSAGGTLNFTGAGLGVDSRNRIFITAQANGLIGPWATVNGTNLAAYSTANGVYAADDSAIYTDIAARAPSTITSNDTSYVRINTDGSYDSPIELSAATTRITSLLQNTAIPATVNTSGKTLQTSAISVPNGQASVTVGVAANDGKLSPLLPNGELALNNASANGLTVNAVIADTGASSQLVKYGPGTATLTASNTFAGTVSVIGGSLVLANSDALQNASLSTAGAVFDSSVATHVFTVGGLAGSFSSPLTDNAATPVALTAGKNNANTTFGGSLTGSGSLTKAGLGTLTLSGTNSFTGGLTVGANAGAVAASAGGALGLGPIANNSTLNLTAGAVLYSGLSTSLSGTGTVNVTLGTGTATTTLNGDYSGFTGIWNIGTGAAAGAGKAQMHGADNIAATINILSNATLWVDAAGTHNASITLKGGDTGESYGQLRMEGTANWSGPVTLASPMTSSADAFFGCNSGAGYISGSIGDLGKGYTVDTIGAGVLSFFGANTYLGPTWVKGGTLRVPAFGSVNGGPSPLGAATTAANGTVKLGTGGTGATISYVGMGETTDRTIDLAGTTGGGVIDHSGTNQFVLTGDVISSGIGAKRLTLQGSTIGTGVVAGVINNSFVTNAVDVYKNGTGTWKLTGNNLFKGNVEINQGALIITQSGALGVSNKQVRASNGTTGNPYLVLDGSAGNIVLGTNFTFYTSNTTTGSIVNAAGTNTILGNFSLTGGGGGTAIHVSAGKLTLGGTLTPDQTLRDLRLRGNGDGEISGSIANGLTVDMPLTKEMGTGTWLLSGANTYSGVSTVNSGTLAVGGANGSIAGGVAVNAGGTFAVANSALQNSANRLSDTGTVTLANGVFTYSHTGGAANYSETAGPFVISSGSNILTTAQADATQSSILTFASISRTGNGSIDFRGTGLGLDDRNKVLFAASPGTGLIGLWATYNSTNFAAYDNTLGVVAAGDSTFTNLTAKGPALIPDNTALNARINSEGTDGPIGLAGAPASSVKSLLQNSAWASTVGMTNQTLLVNDVMIAAGQQALTLGTAENEGLIMPLTAGGTLTLINQANSTLTLNAAVTNNTTTSVVKLGSGTVKLNGRNSYTGTTLIDAGALEFGVNSTQILNSVISGAGTLVKSGTNMLQLLAANTYTGPTYINQGIVRANQNTTFGTTAGGIFIANGATLDVGCTPDVGGTRGNDLLNLGNELITVQGNGFDGNGAIVNNSATGSQTMAISQVSLSGDASFGGKQRWDIRSNTPILNLNGYKLTKLGPNYVPINNTLVTPGTGCIDVVAGYLRLEQSPNLQGSVTNTLTVENGATLDYYTFGSAVAPVWTLVLNAGSTVSVSSGNGTLNTWAGPVTLNGATTFTGGNTGYSETFSGPISGSGPIYKTGVAVAYLTSTNNTYTGSTVVSNGTLNAKCIGSLPGYDSGRATVLGGGTLTVPTGDGITTGWTAAQIKALYDANTFYTNTATLGFDTTLADLSYADSFLKPMSLLKQGTNALTLTGTLNLFGTNTAYGALTVNGGDLVINGTANHRLGAVTVGNANLWLTNATAMHLYVTNSTAIVGNAATDFGRMTLAGNAAWASYLPAYNNGSAVLYVGYNGRGVLTIQDNATLTNRLYLGNAAGSHGAIYQRGNSLVNHWCGANSDGRIGYSGYGYYELSSGTLTNMGYCQVGWGTTGIGIVSQYGGKLQQGAVYGGDLSISRGGTGVVYLAGGTFASSVGMTVGAISDNSGSRGFADFTMAANSSASAYLAGNVTMADRTNMFAIVNLNGGTLTATQFSKSSSRTGSLALVNFNGGTFCPRASTNLFATGVNAPDLVNIYPGGATFDSTNLSVVVPVPLLAPTGNGVGSIAITPRGGYIGPPFVTISGGGGTGATAIAQFDSNSGTVNGITITSPGFGYTSYPAVTLSGGGTNLQIAVTGMTLAPNTSGGLTKVGTGMLTLNATNTYTGVTTVSDGILRVGVANALPSNAVVNVAGGVYDLAGLAVTNSTITVSSGEIRNGTLSASSLTKAGNGTVILTASPTVAGTIMIAGGTLQLTGVQPGLYESRVAGSFDVTTPNPQTATKLSATNAYLYFAGTASSGGVWIDNSTYIYSGYLWNNAATNENWTFNKYFDDSVLLKIDNTTVINNTVSSTNLIANFIMTPGPHPLELRLGQGTGNVGFGGGYPGVGFDRLGRNTRNSAFFQRLSDPGNGSLLTLSLLTGTNQLATASSVDVAANATLNLGGTVQTLSGLTGNGLVTNGTLAVSGTIAPGGTNVIGTLTVAASSTFTGSLLTDVNSSGACDLLAVRGDVNISGLALLISNPDQLDRHQQYTILTCSGTRSGIFSSNNLPNSRWHVSYGTDGSVKLVFVDGTLLKLL